MLNIAEKQKYGLGTGSKRAQKCRKCGADYWYRVYWNTTKKIGWRCGPCSSKWRKEWKERNRDKYRNWGWRQNKINITVDEYNELFQKQGGACAVCKRTDRKLRVDHCHLTGRIRGLLCSGCNALAQDAALLRRILTYVEGGDA